MRIRALLGLLLVCCLDLSSPAQATTAVRVDERTLLAQSTAVVLGMVERIRTSADPATDALHTDIVLRIEEVVSGRVSGALLILREMGGHIDDRTEWLFGSAEYVAGERVLVFAERTAPGRWRTASMAMGKFSVQSTATGEEIATRAFGTGVTLYEPASGELIAHPSAETFDLQQLLARVRAHGSPGGASGAADPPVLDDVDVRADGGTAAFTFLNASAPARWYEPDDGNAVGYTIDQTGDAKLGLTASRTAVGTALAAWTNVATSSLTLVDSGLAAPAQYAGCTGGNRIVFNDPWSEVTDPVGCSGILAIGGYCRSNTTREVNGVDFYQIVVGKLMFNNGFGNCPGWNTCALAEVAAHELGHTIGIGHSADPNATMYATAHFDGRCATLEQDDRDAATFMYPLAGPSPTPTDTRTRTSTPTVTWTPLPTNTRTATFTPSATSTRTDTATPISTRTPSATRTATNTFPPSATPTETPIPPPSATPSETPTRTPTRTLTNTRTPTSTATATNSPLPSATRTDTHTPAPTFTPSESPTRTLTRTPTSTRTPSFTATTTNTPPPSATPSETSTPLLTSTPSESPTRSHTRTPTSSRTPSFTATISSSPQPSATPSETAEPPPTATHSHTATRTATRTPTDTRTPTLTPSHTSTAVPTTTRTDTATTTPTRTSTSTRTATDTVEPTQTQTPTATHTSSPTRSATPTRTGTGTAPQTATLTTSPTTTHTRTSTATASPTGTRSPTLTATVTGTATDTPEPTETREPTATRTTTTTRTATMTPSATDPPEPTSTATATRTASPSRTPTVTRSPTDAPTATETVAATPRAAASNTPTPSPTRTATPTRTRMETPTATETEAPSPTRTASRTRTPSATESPTSSPTRTPSATLSPSAIATASSTASRQPSLTPTATATDAPTAKATPTATETEEPLPTATEIVATATRTRTPNATATDTDTATPTQIVTDPPTVSATSTPTSSPTEVPPSATPTPVFTPRNPLPSASPTSTGAAETTVVGRVFYFGSDTSVADARIAVIGSGDDPARSSGNGSYRLNRVPTGLHSLTVTKLGDGRAAVGASDAVAVLEAVSHVRELDAMGVRACDADGNRRLDRRDAEQILDLMIGARTRLPVADLCQSDWLFFPFPDRNPLSPYELAASDHNCPTQPARIDAAQQPIQDFAAILAGNCSGTWPPAQPADFLTTVDPSHIVIGRPLRGRGSRIRIPIVIDAEASYTAAEIRLTLDTERVRPVRIRPRHRDRHMVVRHASDETGVMIVIATSRPQKAGAPLELLLDLVPRERARVVATTPVATQLRINVAGDSLRKAARRRSRASSRRSSQRLPPSRSTPPVRHRR